MNIVLLFEKMLNEKIILQVVNTKATGIKPYKFLTKNKVKWGWNSFFIIFFKEINYIYCIFKNAVLYSSLVELKRNPKTVGNHD